jgi:hypothetical protein
MREKVRGISSPIRSLDRRVNQTIAIQVNVLARIFRVPVAEAGSLGKPKKLRWASSRGAILKSSQTGSNPVNARRPKFG